MTYWKNYAFIKDEKIANIAVYAPDGAYTIAGLQAKQFCGPDAIAIDVTQYPVNIGDDYKDGRFYRNGAEIEALPTDEEEIRALKTKLESITESSLEASEAVDSIIISMAEA